MDRQHMQRVVLALALGFAVPACGDNIRDETWSLQMCLIHALANCEAQFECGLIDELGVATCAGELRDLCCAEYDECMIYLPITTEERYVCIDHIEAAECEVIEQGPISIEACLGW